MNEMIERVAKALRHRRLGDAVWDKMDGNERNTWESAWDSLDGWDRARLLADAKAAIAAMREPNHSMMDAGCGAQYDHSPCHGVGWQELRFIWLAMIDEALKDG